MADNLSNSSCYAFYQADLAKDGTLNHRFNILSRNLRVPAGFIQIGSEHANPEMAIKVLIRYVVDENKDDLDNVKEKSWVHVFINVKDDNQDVHREEWEPTIFKEIHSMYEIENSDGDKDLIDNQDDQDNEDDFSDSEVNLNTGSEDDFDNQVDVKEYADDLSKFIEKVVYPLSFKDEKEDQKAIDKQTKKVEDTLRLSTETSDVKWLTDACEDYGNPRGRFVENLIRKMLDDTIDEVQNNSSKILSDNEQVKRFKNLIRIVEGLRYPNLYLHLAYSPTLILLFFDSSNRKPDANGTILFQQMVVSLSKIPDLAKSSLDNFWTYVITKGGVYVGFDQVRIGLEQLCRAHFGNPDVAIMALFKWSNLGPSSVEGLFRPKKAKVDNLQYAWDTITKEISESPLALCKRTLKLLDKMSDKKKLSSRNMKIWKDLLISEEKKHSQKK